MSLREKIRRNAVPLLVEDEEIQAVIPAKMMKPSRLDSGGNLALIATDKRILLCKSGYFRASLVRRVLGEFPRETPIGPAHGIVWYECQLPIPQPKPGLSFSVWIHRRFFKDVADADVAERQATAVW